MVSAFHGLPLLFRGDFNVTLEVGDRPNEAGGRDSGLEEFWIFISESALQDMGPADCRFTWRSSTGPHKLSSLDRFLCSIDILELFPLTDIWSPLRPLSDHNPITWQTHEGEGRKSYFKFDRSRCIL